MQPRLENLVDAAKSEPRISLAGEPPKSSSALDDALAEGDFREARRKFEVEFLGLKLREHGGNVTRTAAAIGLERQSLQEKIRKLALEFRDETPTSPGKNG